MSGSLRNFDRTALRASFRTVNWNPSGKVTDVVGILVEAHLPGARLGTVVNILVKGQQDVLAEVVGFKDDKVLLLPYGNLDGISPGCAVTGKRTVDRLPVGDFLLGKVIDPLMNCLTGKLEIPERAATVPLDRDAPNPMMRERIAHPLCLGVRAIDALLTFGEGQRVGVMASAGVGKSVLMGMIARGSSADINVIGLIGERGREVKEFLERDLGPEGLARSVVVCVTGDQSPLMRVRAAKAVVAIAEAFSARGKSVLVMMDSLTRVAMAQREIGLARGEPPTTRGYTPSVFSLLPRLLERCGPQPAGHGSISGLFTVLAEGAEVRDDPIAEAARSILDGHIILSRDLANKGHFPAIDVPESVSRVMTDIVTKEHADMAMMIRAMLGAHKEARDLLDIGAYQAGSNATIDAAIALMPYMEAFLKQGIAERTTFEKALEGMQGIFKGGARDMQARDKQGAQGR